MSPLPALAEAASGLTPTLAAADDIFALFIFGIFMLMVIGAKLKAWLEEVGLIGESAQDRVARYRKFKEELREGLEQAKRSKGQSAAARQPRVEQPEVRERDERAERRRQEAARRERQEQARQRSDDDRERERQRMLAERAAAVEPVAWDDDRPRKRSTTDVPQPIDPHSLRDNWDPDNLSGKFRWPKKLSPLAQALLAREVFGPPRALADYQDPHLRFRG